MLMARCASVFGFALVARCASENGSRAAKCGCAHASRKWFTSFTLREDSRAPTSLRSPTSNTHSLPRGTLERGGLLISATPRTIISS